jgi:hypothetical protein
LGATCVSPVDPDQGRFACASSADCGSGWECLPQFSGGDRCFKVGVCEAFDLAADSANCGFCTHACAAGTGCADAGCVEVACGDGVDNDLNGLTDCADPACLGQRCDADAGRCGLKAPDAGSGDGGAGDAGADGGPGLVRGCFAP